MCTSNVIKKRSERERERESEREKRVAEDEMHFQTEKIVYIFVGFFLTFSNAVDENSNCICAH